MFEHLTAGSPSPGTDSPKLPEWIALQQAYPQYMCFGLLALLALLAAVHWTRRALASIARDSAPRDVERGAPHKGAAVSWRRLPAAAAATFRILAFRLPLPLGLGDELLGAELLLIAAYMAAIWTWMFVRTDNFTLREYTQRAALMAVAQLPFVIGLSGKNNVISFLTGVTHEKLNIFHRAAARSVLILLWIHFLGNYALGNLTTATFGKLWIIAGLVSLGALTLNTLITLKPIRRLLYEAFLVSHILLNIAFLVGGWYHVCHFRTPATRWMDYYYIPGFLLWGLDRLARACRTLYNNRRAPPATLELLSPDTVRLTLARGVRWRAGQHAYVLLPGTASAPSEAHPFTIAGAPDALDGARGCGERQVSFIIRARGGATRRLLERAQKGERSVPALMDGPYGAPPDLSSFSTVILVAGGSGVSYTLAMLMNLVSLANQDKAAVRRIVFIWAIRDIGHADWIAPALHAAILAAPRRLEISTHVHATNMSPAAFVDFRDDESTLSPCGGYKDKAASLSSVDVSRPFSVAPGRPDVARLIGDELDVAGGTVSVDVCGPAELATAVRRATRFSGAGPAGVLRGRAPVTLHVEKFGM